VSADDGSLSRRLAGRRAVVTGAGAGIGRAIATRLAAEGARVLIADLDEDAATGVADEIGPPALSHAVDVADESSVAAMIARATDEWGGLDVLVNNAGIGVAAQTPDTDGVNGLVYAATDATAMTQVSTSATKAGIKVVGIGSGTDPQPPNVPLLATNNIAGAKLAADQLAKAIGPSGGTIAIIAFHAGSQTNDLRVQGFEAELKKHPNLHLVGIQYSQNDYNTALTVTSNVLTANPDLKGLFAATSRATSAPSRRSGSPTAPASQDHRMGHLPRRGEGRPRGDRVRPDLPGPVQDGLRRSPRGRGARPPSRPAAQREHGRRRRHSAKPEQPGGASVHYPTLRLPASS
jgi:NAD(P)-dependent dehydrogenase (short-subunit alcohol dehydrogenase family)